LCPAPLLSSLRLTCDFTWKKTGGHQVVDLEWKIPSINGFLYFFLDGIFQIYHFTFKMMVNSKNAAKW
jgi:hypothetical protein